MRAAVVMTLTELIAIYRDLLYLPDLTPLLGALATVAANRLPTGDPVWTLLVGPPSSGKSEIIDSLRVLPEAASLSTLTKASLLSGHHASGGGLLLTTFRSGRGLLLIKDFTSILSETPATRNELLALLREVFDGHVERAVGTRATPLAWAGKLGLVSGVTEEIELHRQTIAGMGERFVYLPMTSTEHDRDQIARRAMRNGGDQQRLRARIADAVRQFFAQLPIPDGIVDIPQADRHLLIAAADLGSRARSSVVRDTRTRDISLVHEAELPARLVGELSQLWRGLHLIGADRCDARAQLRAATIGGIPKTRRTALLALVKVEGWSTTAQVSARTRSPSSTTQVVLEDLAALGLVDSDAGDGPMWTARIWAPTTWARERWAGVNDGPRPGDVPTNGP
jgi:hypothetical protein